jgi:hypothetical protein
MDPHGGRLDPEAGGGPRRLADAARAALAALVDAAGRLGPASRRRLGEHFDQRRSTNMSKAPKPIDTALRDAIRGSGLTHYALGKAAGVAPAQLDRFVSGERSLTLASAAKVATALGLVLVPRR